MKPGEAFESLVDVMAKLRAPDGCPWDRDQTLESLKTYVVEEAYEVVQAIDDGRPEELKDELGDLLLQVVFQARILEEQGHGGAADVCEGQANKLIGRHPHVFGNDEKAKDAADVLSRWEGYKKKEGRGLLAGVPASLPALLMAFRVSQKARSVGFDWPDLAGAVAKLDEETSEFKEAIASGSRERIEAELGDVLFTLANLARAFDINPEDALRKMLVRFKRRFEHMEKRLEAEGRQVKGTPMPALDALWEEAKVLESAG